MKSNNTHSDIIAFFAGACLFFATLEYLIPKPFPFFRVGFANIPILLTISVFRVRDVFLLAVLKTCGQAIIHGTLLSYVFLFSAIGTMSSTIVMYLAALPLRVDFTQAPISLVGVSVLGALASNAAQVMCAALFIFGASAWVLFTPFLFFGTASGIFVGVLAENLQKNAVIKKLYHEYLSSKFFSAI